jgi:type I restriction enzyme M protein
MAATRPASGAAGARALRPARGASFYDLYEARNEANIGELINIALERIEDANKAKLEGVFRNIDFNSEANLGDQGPQPPPEEPAGGLRQAQARPAPVSRVTEDIIGECYIYLIGASPRRRQEGGRVLHALRQVSKLLAKLAAPKPGDTHLRPCLRFRLAADQAPQEVRAPRTLRSSARK